MATPNQIEANRKNAQKSTGPRSVEGKAASRFNALKTGIDAESQVIPGEDPGQLEDLVAAYQARFSTASPERRLLVDTLVNCEWLLRRLSRGEADLWVDAIERTKCFIRGNDNPEGRVLYFNDQVFGRLQRRINSIQVNYHRALKELQRLEAEEPPRECLPVIAQPISNQPPGPQIGFVPSTPAPAPFSPPAPPATPEFQRPVPPVLAYFRT